MTDPKDLLILKLGDELLRTSRQLSRVAERKMAEKSSFWQAVDDNAPTNRTPPPHEAELPGHKMPARATFHEETAAREAVKFIIKFVGDDPTREGLKETPNRVRKSWDELFSGYRKNPASVFKTFDAGTYDEIVLLKNVEFFSTCEHHMIPFVGTASIAYIPDHKIIGLSKLARLLEIFTRRLQVQEKITTDVVAALMEHLEPKGAACVLKAKHFCMCARGVNKQRSEMVTSCLKGAFRDNPAARAELFQLIGG